MVSGTITLTNLGTVAERASVCDWLRRRLGSTRHVADLRSAERPPGLAHDPRRRRRDPSGAPHPRPFAVAAVMAVLTAIALYACTSTPAPRPAVALAGRGDRAVVPRRGVGRLVARRVDRRPQRLEYRLRFGPLVRERFRNAHLEMTSHTDSDGDTRYKLLVRDAEKKRTITLSIFDDPEVVDCARWMEAATGFRLVK